MLRPPRRFAALSLVACGVVLAACTVPAQRPARQPPPIAAPGPAPPDVTVTPAPPLAPGGQGAVDASKVAVGILLPLSGPSAAIGQAMLDAAQMAIFDLGDNKLRLLVRDTAGNPSLAAEGARAELAEGAQLVLGPLLAGEVEAVQPITQAANVPLLAFSTATQLAGNGTYLLGFDPRQEVERIFRFAQARGRTRFAVFAPVTAYGDVTVAAARDIATVLGVSLTRVGRYDPTAPSLSSAVQSFAAGADFDALLVPEGGQRLKTLTPFLSAGGVDPAQVKLLGTGLWDEPGLGSEPSLEGAWYAAPPPQARADFQKRFTDTYKRAPARLATLAYDATALAAVLARTPDFSAAALTNPSGYAGLDGIFRLRADGVAERGLAVLEVHRTGTTVIDEAPTSFQAAPKY